jgi:multidrug efflux system membrane fusion protein
MRPVTVGRAVGREIVISKGIAPGETVVTDGQLRLGPGFPVEIVSAGPAAAVGKAVGASQ